MLFPVSYYVHSSLAYFGLIRGGELPGRWFVEGLAEAGWDEATVRQALYRMERARELTSRREGREKHYAPSSYARGEITAGTDKLFRSPDPWDGRWTFVSARFERGERMHRLRIQELLRIEGFAAVGSGLHVHPRPRGERILAAADPAIRDRLIVLRGDRLGPEPASRFIARHWDIPALALRYRKTLAILKRLSSRSGPRTDADAFRRRFEVVMRFLSVAWDDPDLPLRLLPDPWPGAQARELAAAVYRRFLPGAIRFGDEVLARVGHEELAVGRKR